MHKKAAYLASWLQEATEDIRYKNWERGLAASSSCGIMIYDDHGWLASYKQEYSEQPYY